MIYNAQFSFPFVFPAVERLPSLSDEEWAVFLSQLSSALAEPSTSAHLSPSSPARSAAMAIRSRLNLLCYLCSVVWQKVVANRLMNSTVVGHRDVRRDCWELHWTQLQNASAFPFNCLQTSRDSS